jgi:hypothetical protein
MQMEDHINLKTAMFILIICNIMQHI